MGLTLLYMGNMYIYIYMRLRRQCNEGNDDNPVEPAAPDFQEEKLWEATETAR